MIGTKTKAPLLEGDLLMSIYEGAVVGPSWYGSAALLCLEAGFRRCPYNASINPHPKGQGRSTTSARGQDSSEAQGCEPELTPRKATLTPLAELMLTRGLGTVWCRHQGRFYRSSSPRTYVDHSAARGKGWVLK